MITKLAGVILILATIAAGIYVDLVWLLVDGIREIIRGAQAHPLNGSDIGWGVAHVVFTGLGVAAAVLLCLVWAALFLGHSVPRRRMARR